MSFSRERSTGTPTPLELARERLAELENAGYPMPWDAEKLQALIKLFSE